MREPVVLREGQHERIGRERDLLQPFLASAGIHLPEPVGHGEVDLGGAEPAPESA